MEQFYRVQAITPGKASFNGVYQYPFFLPTYSLDIKCRAIRQEPFTAMDGNPATLKTVCEQAAAQQAKNTLLCCRA